MENLRKITSKVLGIEEEKINDELSREKEELWDSFNHLLLVSEIEKEMGIKFTMPEVEEIKTFKDLNKLIEEKIK